MTILLLQQYYEINYIVIIAPAKGVMFITTFYRFDVCGDMCLVSFTLLPGTCESLETLLYG